MGKRRKAIRWLAAIVIVALIGGGGPGAGGMGERGQGGDRRCDRSSG